MYNIFRVAFLYSLVLVLTYLCVCVCVRESIRHIPIITENVKISPKYIKMTLFFLAKILRGWFYGFTGLYIYYTAMNSLPPAEFSFPWQNCKKISKHSLILQFLNRNAISWIFHLFSLIFKIHWGERPVEDIPIFTCECEFVCSGPPGQTKNNEGMKFGTHTPLDNI